MSRYATAVAALLVPLTLVACTAGGPGSPATTSSATAGRTATPTPTSDEPGEGTPSPGGTASGDPAPSDGAGSDGTGSDGAGSDGAGSDGTGSGGGGSDGAPPPGDEVVLVTWAGYSADAGALEVAGMLPVVRDGGECVLRARLGRVTVEETSPALPDASSTTCGTLRIPRDRLSPGTWTVTLSHTSAAGTSTSPSQEVVVP